MLPIMGSIFVTCTKSRKNQETWEEEWLQQLELAYVDLMDSKKASYQNVLWGAGSDAARD